MKTLAEMVVGESLPPIELNPVTRMDLIKYSGASGDYNPIHTIDEEANKLGLPGIIAHGMWSMGNLSKLFTCFYEEGFIEEYTVRFKGMVFLGDVITLSAHLEEKLEKRLKFNVMAVNTDNQKVIAGKVILRLFNE